MLYWEKLISVGVIALFGGLLAAMAQDWIGLGCVVCLTAAGGYCALIQ